MRFMLLFPLSAVVGFGLITFHNKTVIDAASVDKHVSPKVWVTETQKEELITTMAEKRSKEELLISEKKIEDPIKRKPFLLEERSYAETKLVSEPFLFKIGEQIETVWGCLSTCIGDHEEKDSSKMFPERVEDP